MWTSAHQAAKSKKRMQSDTTNIWPMEVTMEIDSKDQNKQASMPHHLLA